jgi:hypothetical protein
VRKKVSPINRVLRSKRVIAILLSVSQEDVTEGYQNGKDKDKENESSFSSPFPSIKRIPTLPKGVI